MFIIQRFLEVPSLSGNLKVPGTRERFHCEYICLMWWKRDMENRSRENYLGPLAQRLRNRVQWGISWPLPGALGWHFINFLRNIYFFWQIFWQIFLQTFLTNVFPPNSSLPVFLFFTVVYWSRTCILFRVGICGFESQLLGLEWVICPLNLHFLLNHKIWMLKFLTWQSYCEARRGYFVESPSVLSAQIGRKVSLPPRTDVPRPSPPAPQNGTVLEVRFLKRCLC